MTDNNPEESTNTTGVGGVPRSPDQGGNETGSVITSKLEAALKRINELEGDIRYLKSDKDKRVDKLERRSSSFEEQLAQYEKLIKRMTPEEALEELQYRREREAFLEERKGSGSTAGSASGSSGNRESAVSVDEQAVLNRLGLNANDPEVSRILRETNDPAERLASFAELKVRGQVTQAPINPAQVMPGAGGTTATLTQEKLYAEYRESIKNVAPGEAGTQARFNAKLATRKKAAEAGIESPV